MSAATAPAPAKAPVEPTSLRELYAQAKKDIVAKDGTALLRWVFWHAKAVGRAELARMAREEVRRQERDVRLVLNACTIPSIRAQLEQDLPAAATLRQADEVLLEAVQLEQAARWMVELLRARR